MITLSESRSYINMNVCRFRFWQRISRENYYCYKLFKQVCLCQLRTLRISVNKICSPSDSEKEYTDLVELTDWNMKGNDKSLNHTYVCKQTMHRVL